MKKQKKNKSKRNVRIEVIQGFAAAMIEEDKLAPPMKSKVWRGAW